MGTGAWRCTSLVALTVAAQIYLSMLHHGHSLSGLRCGSSVRGRGLRQRRLCCDCGRLTDRDARSARAAFRVIVTGLVILIAHMLLASVATVGLQPYIPVERFRFGAALIIQVVSLPVDLLVYGLLLVIGAGLAVYQRAQNLEVRESRLEADLARAQLDALRLEIEPHFLFNSLNSIAALIRSRSSDRALSMLLELSELLRAAVEGRRQHTTTLAEETAFVKRHIDLQRRYVSATDSMSDMKSLRSPSDAPCRCFSCSPSSRTLSGTGSRDSRGRAIWSSRRQWTAVSCTFRFVTTGLACRPISI